MTDPTDITSDNDSNSLRKLTRNQILTLISTATLNFSSMIIYSILGPFFPQEAVKKGLSNTVIGLIFGCFALINFSSSLILGRYLVQIGAKFMFVSGLLASGLATVLFGLLDRISDGTIFTVMCFLVRSLDAVGFGASIISSFSILAKAFPKNVATVMGFLEIVTGLGLVLGPPIGGLMYQAFGYEVPFIAIGGTVLLMVPLNMYILPQYDAVPSNKSFWTLATLPKIMVMCVTAFSMSSCLGFLDPTMSLFLIETFHLKVGYVGLVFLGLALSYSLSSPLLGIISDKRPEMRKWLVIAGNLGTAVCFIMLGPVPIFHIESKLWLFVFILVLDGFCIGLSAIPVYPEMVSAAYESGFEEGLSTLGLISGLYSAMGSAGAFVGPTLGGFLNEKFHFRWASAMQGLLPLLAFILSTAFYSWEIHKRKRRSQLENSGTIQEREPLLQEDS